MSTSSNSIHPFKHTLLRYNKPVLESHFKQQQQDEEDEGEGTARDQGEERGEDKDSSEDEVRPSSKANMRVEDLLNLILPPQRCEEGGRVYVRTVSSEPASRDDVVELAVRLDEMLLCRGARREGICEIRRSIYKDCLSEIIRQVAINNHEQGLLLVRVRDEMEMNLKYFDVLLDGANTFSTRQSQISSNKLAKLMEPMKVKEEEKKKLQEEINQLKYELETMEREFVEEKQNLDNLHEAKMSFLKQTNSQLNAQLEHVMNMKQAT